MRARILDKSEEDRWGEFVAEHPLGTIHQTPRWGRFQAKIPSRGKYWIIVLEEDEKIVGGTMLIRQKLPGKYCWLYASRGPLVDYDVGNPTKEAKDEEANEDFKFQTRKLLEKAGEIAKKEKAIFMRVDPPIHSLDQSPFLSLTGFKKTKFGFHPEHTLIIDLTGSEDEILGQMKPKGRYNIRLAEKKGIKIEKTDSQDPDALKKDLDDFYRILRETTKRDKFSPHNKDYYMHMMETLCEEDECPKASSATSTASATTSATSPSSATAPSSQKSVPGNGFASPVTRLYLAKHEGKTIAGIIVTFYKDTAIYYYGASSNEHRNLMAPYLLQWHAIKEAKNRGCKYYDFLGIAPPENAASSSKPHPWQGVTAFKKKFGGTAVSYSPATEYPFKKLLYFIYTLYKKSR